MGLKYLSETITHVSGSTKAIPLDFIPKRGPTGKRFVVTKLYVEATFSLTTDGATTVDEDDLCDLIKEIRIRDIAGLRRRMPGWLIQAKMMEEMGERKPAVPSAIAISQTGTSRTFYGWIHFARPRALEPNDTAIPADVLAGLELDMPAGSNLRATGGTVTIVSGTYKFVAHGYEERTVVSHVRDVINYVDQESAAVARLNVDGASIRSLALFKSAAGGGTAVSTITDVTVDALGMNAIPLAALQKEYTGLFDVSSDDWVSVGKALPIITPEPFAKITEYPIVQGSLLTRLNQSGWSAGSLAYDFVVDHDRTQVARELDMHGIDPSADPEVKTSKKSSKKVDKWHNSGLHRRLPLNWGESRRV